MQKGREQTLLRARGMRKTRDERGERPDLINGEGKEGNKG